VCSECVQWQAGAGERRVQCENAYMRSRRSVRRIACEEGRWQKMRRRGGAAARTARSDSVNLQQELEAKGGTNAQAVQCSIGTALVMNLPGVRQCSMRGASAVRRQA